MNLKELSKLDVDVPGFDNILKFVSQIKNAKTDGDDDVYTVPLGALRDDTVRKSLARNAVLSNAPQSDGEYFIVPKVVE